MARRAAKRLTEADGEVHEIFEDHRHHPIVKAIGIASELGDQPQLRLISGACIAVGLIRSDRRLLSAGARTLVAHELATFAKDLIKRRVDRTRPRSADTARDRRPKPGENTAKEETSFPSGHTAGSVAVARAFSREYPEHRTAALSAAGLIAAAQIPRCAHYVSDVGAGALIGLAAEAASDLIWKVGRTEPA